MVEESDETEMWLDLVIASKVNDTDLAKELWSESLEILKIMATARKKFNPSVNQFFSPTDRY